MTEAYHEALKRPFHATLRAASASLVSKETSMMATLPLHRAAPLFAIAVMAAADRSADAEPCPESCVVAYYTHCSTSAQIDTSGSAPWGRGLASYDLTVGQIGTLSISGYDGGFTTEVIARDRFMVVGPQSPEPIPFSASLSVQGQGSCACQQYSSSELVARLREGNNPPVEASSYGTPSEGSFLDQALSLPLQFSVGDSFELTYTALARVNGTSNSARLGGQLSFVLPPGYGVVSCQGYSYGPVVATAPTSWGMIKIRYR